MVEETGQGRLVRHEVRVAGGSSGTDQVGPYTAVKTLALL